jgi:uncharacterized protein YndB with AHSA1/START domain
MIDVDITDQVNNVERRIGTRTLEAGEARTLTISRVYDTSVEDLWDACTNPERIPRWFLPVSGDFKIGGRYALEGNASGTIERCEPPRSFFATWEYGGMVSWVELTLTPEADGRVRFTLDHIAHVDDEMSAQYGPGAVGIGWDLGLMGLTAHLTTGADRPPIEEAFAWQTSDEGRDFVAAISAEWSEASIAFGTDPAEARAAQERVTEAYTAPPPAA